MNTPSVLEGRCGLIAVPNNTHLFDTKRCTTFGTPSSIHYRTLSSLARIFAAQQSTTPSLSAIDTQLFLNSIYIKIDSHFPTPFRATELSQSLVQKHITPVAITDMSSPSPLLAIWEILLEIPSHLPQKTFSFPNELIPFGVTSPKRLPSSGSSVAQPTWCFRLHLPPPTH